MPDNFAMTFSRRAFVSASSAFALTAAIGPRAFAQALPRSADVVVIGAGAAGIAAARRVIAGKRSVIVVEAGTGVGGRCQTDTTSFGTAFDRGARFLHNPDSNVLIRLARAAGVEIYAAPPGQKLRIGRRNARAGETETLLAALVRANRAISDAAKRGDIASASVQPKDLGIWNDTIRFLLGPYTTGKDLTELSTLDQSRAVERLSEIGCRTGLGGLMQAMAQGLPVSLGTPVQGINWRGRELSIDTPKGKIAARSIIVTVSSQVLASGHIRFTPDLPKRTLDAVNKLTLGSTDRIALVLEGNPLGLGRDELLIEQSSDARTGVLLANIAGSSLCTVDVAGAFGRDLAAQGEAAMVAFATEWLTKLYGSDIAGAIRRTATTNWNAAPHILGAMSAAVPGGGGARKILAEPQGNLFFAGEATHETLWGSVDGAWESGERAADAALAALGPLQAAAPVAAGAPAKKPRKRKRAE